MSDLKVSLPQVLESDRLRLLPFTPEHIQANYVAWLNDPQVVQFSNQRFYQHTESSCRHYLASFVNTENIFLAIEDRLTHDLIGTLTMYINPHHQTADVGILIDKTNHWGKGYGYEAFALAVNALLHHGKLRKVTAGTMACNLGMVKVMEKCGMALEATRKAQELLDGQAVDILYFAKFSTHSVSA
ncbi:MAG: N-acetyltransferase [Limnohabitans sp.]|nr:N-acetyltransferase [Limnohabitans sp.]